MLNKKGKLIIYDFNSEVTRKLDYKHIKGETISKRNYREMFAWHPCYEVITEKNYSEYPHRELVNKEEVRVTTLQKN